MPCRNRSSRVLEPDPPVLADFDLDWVAADIFLDFSYGMSIANRHATRKFAWMGNVPLNYWRALKGEFEKSRGPYRIGLANALSASLNVIVVCA